MESNDKNTSPRKKYLLAIGVLLIILILDQWLKFWIKTNMAIGDEIAIFGNWFKLHFTENCGMAFGFRPGGDDGKIILTVFRMFAAVGISWYLIHIIRRSASVMAVVCFTLILAGALGNILDSVFYGWLFSSSSPYQIATIDPLNGYAPWFKGCVVDMLYFPMITGHFPDWLLGGRYFEFFRPIFNIADASISIGVFTLILFQRSIFVRKEDERSLSDDLNETENDHLPANGDKDIISGPHNAEDDDSTE